MKIETDGVEIVCSLEYKNDAFLSACAGTFNGFYHGKLKLDKLTPEECIDESTRLGTNVYWLERLLEKAKKFGIFVGQSVFDRLESMKSRLSEICPPIAVQPTPQDEKRWKMLCKNGCGSCKNLRRWDDDHFCATSGDLLEEDNCSGIVNGVYHIVNFVPFPSESCPFNTQKTKGVT